MRAGSKVSEVLSSLAFRTGLRDLVDRYNKRVALANDKVPLRELMRTGIYIYLQVHNCMSLYICIVAHVSTYRHRQSL